MPSFQLPFGLHCSQLPFQQFVIHRQIASVELGILLFDPEKVVSQFFPAQLHVALLDWPLISICFDHWPAVHTARSWLPFGTCTCRTMLFVVRIGLLVL